MYKINFILNQDSIWHWMAYKEGKMISSNVSATIDKAEEMSLKFIRSSGKVKEISLFYSKADDEYLDKMTSINSQVLKAIKNNKYSSEISYQEIWDLEDNLFNQEPLNFI